MLSERVLLKFRQLSKRYPSDLAWETVGKYSSRRNDGKIKKIPLNCAAHQFWWQIAKKKKTLKIKIKVYLIFSNFINQTYTYPYSPVDKTKMQSLKFEEKSSQVIKIA